MNHTLCGLMVASDLPLPELAPWTGDDRAPDIEIRLGAVPDRLEGAVHEGPLLQVAADGACRFAVAGVAAYLVEGGRRVTVQPAPDAGAPDVRVFLLGSVFGALCHQRGLLPLHAGCVEIGGAAVAFAGPSGAGKSTLTAAFARQGFRVLADDVTVVDAGAPGGPRVLPSFPRIKLWQDALDGLGLPADGLERVRAGLEKFCLPVAGFRTEPLPLAAVYHLTPVADARHAGVEPLRGSAAVDALLNAVYRHRAALHMGRRSALLAAALRLAAVPMARLSRAHGLAGLDGTVAEVVRRHTDGGRDGGR